MKSEGFSVLSAFRDVSLLSWVVLVAFITSDDEWCLWVPSLVIYILSWWSSPHLFCPFKKLAWLLCVGRREITYVYFLVVYGFINLSSPVWWFLETESYCIAQTSRELLIHLFLVLELEELTILCPFMSFSYRMEVDFWRQVIALFFYGSLTWRISEQIFAYTQIFSSKLLVVFVWYLQFVLGNLQVWCEVCTKCSLLMCFLYMSIIQVSFVKKTALFFLFPFLP